MKIVVFSGAGMSAESGISTFRDSGGLWENYKIEDVATPQAWLSDPDLVTNFYNHRRKNILETQPNEAHLAIAELEKLTNVHVVTQNIDDLHERAGSNNVLHLHGNIRFAKSSGPDQEKVYYPIEGWELKANHLCEDGYRLRPHVVWFGEAVPAYDDATSIIESADIFIVIGTSLQVYPAAGLVNYARNAKMKFLIDPNANELNGLTDYIVYNKQATEGIRLAVEEIKKVIT
jgi:NAD-dependent deacetylase